MTTGISEYLKCEEREYSYPNKELYREARKKAIDEIIEAGETDGVPEEIMVSINAMIEREYEEVLTAQQQRNWRKSFALAEVYVDDSKKPKVIAFDKFSKAKSIMNYIKEMYAGKLKFQIVQM